MRKAVPTFFPVAVDRMRSCSREKRKNLFKHIVPLQENDRILDLGGGNGSHFDFIIRGTGLHRKNVSVADIDLSAITTAKEKYGFTPVHLSEIGLLPFPDKYFDVVFCSSVIEHVTGKKNSIRDLKSGKEFKEIALRNQKRFADEIVRIGKRYFVQTPSKNFPIETHCWFPLVQFFPRPIQVMAIEMLNSIWIKKTSPDWHLLTREQMRILFPNALILAEKVGWWAKSWIAYNAGTE